MRPTSALLLALALALGGCTLPRDEAIPYYQALLAGDPFTDLIVEIDHAPGRAPSLLAQEHLLKELRNVTSKTRVSVILEASLADDADEVWTAQELLDLEVRTRTTAHEAPIAVLHILYPAGRYERETAGGVTIANPGMGPAVVFLDSIREAEILVGPVPLPRQAHEEIERATLLHEAGHALGLVDNGLPMVRDHEDPGHEGHSANAASVMWWRVDDLQGLQEALLHDGTVPIWFDADDRADMRAAGGR